MRIRDLLKPEGIKLGGSPANKKDTINQMVDLMYNEGNINDKERYRAGVFAREAEDTTGIGDGIAIPHAKTDAVTAPGLAAMTIPNGVDYDSLDGEPVDLVFLIAAPNTKDNVHLEVLSRLSILLMDEATATLDAKTEAAIITGVREMGITLLMIAHRLATIRQCDTIYVINQGKIIQQGTHDVLMADKNGLYYQLNAYGDNH